MGQSLNYNYVHIVFSTKNRVPFIKPPIEDELHNYLGGICKSFECQPLKVGGFTDHVHVLCSLSKKVTSMKLVEEIKSHSSKWMKTKSDLLKNFYWQNGYGLFSVTPTQIDGLVGYIANQHEHHRKVTFQEEFLYFLKKFKIDFDDRYVWD